MKIRLRKILEKLKKEVENNRAPYLLLAVILLGAFFIRVYSGCGWDGIRALCYSR